MYKRNSTTDCAEVPERDENMRRRDDRRDADLYEGARDNENDEEGEDEDEFENEDDDESDDEDYEGEDVDDEEDGDDVDDEEDGEDADEDEDDEDDEDYEGEGDEGDEDDYEDEGDSQELWVGLMMSTPDSVLKLGWDKYLQSAHPNGHHLLATILHLRTQTHQPPKVYQRIRDLLMLYIEEAQKRLSYAPDDFRDDVARPIYKIPGSSARSTRDRIHRTTKQFVGYRSISSKTSRDYSSTIAHVVMQMMNWPEDLLPLGLSPSQKKALEDVKKGSASDDRGLLGLLHSLLISIVTDSCQSEEVPVASALEKIIVYNQINLQTAAWKKVASLLNNHLKHWLYFSRTILVHVAFLGGVSAPYGPPYVPALPSFLRDTDVEVTDLEEPAVIAPPDLQTVRNFLQSPTATQFRSNREDAAVAQMTRLGGWWAVVEGFKIEGGHDTSIEWTPNAQSLTFRASYVNPSITLDVPSLAASAKAAITSLQSAFESMLSSVFPQGKAPSASDVLRSVDQLQDDHQNPSLFDQNAAIIDQYRALVPSGSTLSENAVTRIQRFLQLVVITLYATLGAPPRAFQLAQLRFCGEPEQSQSRNLSLWQGRCWVIRNLVAKQVQAKGRPSPACWVMYPPVAGMLVGYLMVVRPREVQCAPPEHRTRLKTFVFCDTRVRITKFLGRHPTIVWTGAMINDALRSLESPIRSEARAWRQIVLAIVGKHMSDRSDVLSVQMGPNGRHSDVVVEAQQQLSRQWVELLELDAAEPGPVPTSIEHHSIAAGETARLCLLQEVPLWRTPDSVTAFATRMRHVLGISAEGLSNDRTVIAVTASMVFGRSRPGILEHPPLCGFHPAYLGAAMHMIYGLLSLLREGKPLPTTDVVIQKVEPQILDLAYRLWRKREPYRTFCAAVHELQQETTERGLTVLENYESLPQALAHLQVSSPMRQRRIKFTRPGQSQGYRSEDEEVLRPEPAIQ
ncbi:hypothetical protein FB107DRAFT_251952 [Schizophyllum commune]